MTGLWATAVSFPPQHSGLMDPCRYVAVTSTTAARVFNIYPQKVEPASMFPGNPAHYRSQSLAPPPTGSDR